jgi:RecB family endonuclease NucS
MATVDINYMTYEELLSFFTKKNSLHNIRRSKKKYSINNAKFFSVSDIAKYLYQTFNVKCQEDILQKVLDDHANDASPLEKLVQEKLAKEVNGQMEIQTNVGRIDILTSEEIIEVKKAASWKHAIGQINAYSVYYPKHQKRIHLFGKLPKNSYEDIYLNCERDNIRFTYES